MAQDLGVHQISWQDFLLLHEEGRKHIAGLVDARRRCDPETVIVATAALQIVRIPLEELKERRFELPSRSVSFGIVISNQADLAYLEEIFQSGTKSSSWKVFVILYDAISQQDSPSLDIQCKFIKDVSNTIPHARLWQPDPMVETVLLPLLRQQCKNTREPSIVLDLGSGVGRDVCFLSEELFDYPHLQFVGADQRYRVGQDTTTPDFWKRRGQQHRCRCLCVDLKDNESLFQFLDMNGILCVFAVRYWNEALFERFSRELTRPGTLVGISQFGKPHDDYEWTHSSPKVRFASSLSPMWSHMNRNLTS